MPETTTFSLSVNGDAYELDVEPRKTLADALREDCGLTGTHLGCEHGVCGACTVLLDGRPVRSCLMFAVQCDEAEVTTVEGLAEGGTLSPLQEAFTEHHALQCGFCTPGFLMLATAMLRDGEPLDELHLRDQLASNLCRCTGYQTIVAAVQSAGDTAVGPGGR